MVVIVAAIPLRLGAQTLSNNPFPSTYHPPESEFVYFANATILDGAGNRFARAGLVIRDGRIEAVGPDVPPPGGARVIDAGSQWITPGIVDPHSHLGSASIPYTPAELAAWDVNEIAEAVAPHLYVEATVRAQDPGFRAAVAGGITTLQILPGSANLFGGRGVVLKPVWATTVQAMKFPGAPPSLKMACGENPKYNYSELGKQPASRMGIVAGYQGALEKARRYQVKLENRRKGDEPMDYDPQSQALAEALAGDVRVHFHCYRSEDMAIVLDVMAQYGIEVTAFHHAAEAYKIPDLLIQHNVCGVLFSNWWGFKMENFDAIRENAAILETSGACVSMHSDSALTGQRLNIEAAKAMAAGQHAGLDIPREVAIQWVTRNPARVLGLDDRIGTLEPGKNADVVVWSDDPFSIYAQADLVFIDGALVYDRDRPEVYPVVDFELGQPALENLP
jgi:imidazolonepropionase-like amidohydrolase